jgi:NAD dependent epimerase/dehydratase family enzyme
MGKVLNRPTILPTPAFALRLALGEMADELLLSSTRVAPQKLTAAGYRFQHADVESALRGILGR